MRYLVWLMPRYSAALTRWHAPRAWATRAFRAVLQAGDLKRPDHA